MSESGSGPDWGVGRYERTAEMLLPAAQVLVDAVAPAAGEHVLDLGAGTGNAALLAAAAGADVTAVDPSPRLLSVAAGVAAQRGVRLRCEVGEASELPANTSDVDCLVSNFALIFAPDPDAAVAEIARVLRPTGRAAFTAWLPGGALGALAAAAQEMVRTASGAPPPPPAFRWHEEVAVTELFVRHGMTAVAAGQHELVFADTSPDAFLDAELRTHPMAVSGFEVLRRTGHATEARERLRQVLDEHNEVASSFRATSRYVVFVARHV